MTASDPARDVTDSYDGPPAQGKPALSDADMPEEVEVALGDDAEGALGSSAGPESGGVDTGPR